MFEDSTFESTGRIKTRSRRWMVAALGLNGTILVTLVLLPLIYPDALPQHMIPALLVTPEAPKPQPPPQPVRLRAAAPHDFSELMGRQILVPTRIPPSIKYVDRSEPPFATSIIALDSGPSVPDADSGPFGMSHPATVVHPAAAAVHVPSKLVEGLLIYQNVPPYPIIAKTAGIQGTVVLQATISKSGTIEGLRVVSGHAMLQQAAIDAVKTWHYRPYLLNQQPVEVETTISIIFRLER